MSHPLPPASAVHLSGARAERSPQRAACRQIAIIGAGRLGTVLATGLSRAGHSVHGPLPRHYCAADVAGADIVLLCVPDREIAAAATTWRRHRATGGDRALLGHCSGASGLDVLRAADDSGDRSLFSLHPLMTIADRGAPPRWAGAAAAVAGSSARALEAAVALARELDLTPVSIADGDRAAYHAAASIASNFLVTLQCAAEELAADCGVDREMLAPLVRASVENWVSGGRSALTGPIARGDEATVARQREAVAERTPQLLELFDTLAAATRAIAVAAAGAGEGLAA